MSSPPSFDLSFGSLWLTLVSLLQFDMRSSAFQPSVAIFPVGYVGFCVTFGREEMRRSDRDEI